MLANQPKAAREELGAAIEADNSDPEPYVLLGDIALQEKRLRDATISFERAKKLLAGYRNATRKTSIELQMLSGFAAAAETQSSWKEAEANIREYLKIAPDDIIALQRMARALFCQGQTREAYEFLKKAKAIDRENAKKNGSREFMLVPEAIMGQYYNLFEGPKSKSGNTEKWFRTALKTVPDDLNTRQVVCVWAIENGKMAFAKEQAEAVLRIEASDKMYGGSTAGRMLRGCVAIWEKDWPTAELQFEKILIESPGDFAARNNIALALVEQNDPAKKQRALDYASANISNGGGLPEALSTMVWVRYRRGEFDEAAKALDRVVKTSTEAGRPIDEDTVTYKAHVLYHEGKELETKELLQKVLNAGRAFCMKPEAEALYEKVKDVTKPDAAPKEKQR